MDTLGRYDFFLIQKKKKTGTTEPINNNTKNKSLFLIIPSNILKVTTAKKSQINSFSVCGFSQCDCHNYNQANKNKRQFVKEKACFPYAVRCTWRPHFKYWWLQGERETISHVDPLRSFKSSNQRRFFFKKNNALYVLELIRVCLCVYRCYCLSTRRPARCMPSKPWKKEISLLGMRWIGVCWCLFLSPVLVWCVVVVFSPEIKRSSSRFTHRI